MSARHKHLIVQLIPHSAQYNYMDKHVRPKSRVNVYAKFSHELSSLDYEIRLKISFAGPYIYTCIEVLLIRIELGIDRVVFMIYMYFNLSC